ncbi:MAG: hypothetical protein NTW96_03275, partial [Planctomycetia bacterium]|nr:hypothetical protein [Planctomycetia bacterium]
MKEHLGKIGSNYRRNSLDGGLKSQSQFNFRFSSEIQHCWQCYQEPHTFEKKQHASTHDATAYFQ